MSWFKENKFVAGLLVVTLLAAGGLIYLLLQEKGRYEAAEATFQQKSGDLKRLQSLPAFPARQNQEQLEKQRVEHLAMISDLQKNLAAAEIPLENISPTEFQDQLSKIVKGYVDKAAKAPMDLPKGFYMGFEGYQTSSPTPETAPLLFRELKAIQLVLQTVLNPPRSAAGRPPGRVTALRNLVRDPLADENKPKAAGAAPPKPIPKPAGNKPGAKAPAVPAEPLVKAYGLDLTFEGDQIALQDVLNALVSSREQFIIVRYLSEKRVNERIPSKEVKEGFIFVPESIEVTMRLELIDFAEPPSAEATAPPKSKRNPAK